MIQWRISQPTFQPNEKTHGIRVAFFSDAITDRNGVGAYYRDLLEHLQEHVGQAEMYCPQIEGGLSNGRLGFPMPGDTTQKLFVPNMRYISRHLRQSKPNILVVATPGPFGLLGAYLARRLEMPLCVGYHTHCERLADMYWRRGVRHINRGYFVTVHRLLFRSSDIVVATSDEMAGDAEAKGALRVEQVGTPLAPYFLVDPPPPPKQIRTVLYAGRLAPEKNLGALLHAVREMPFMKFCIAGDGPMRREVVRESMRSPNLDYRGWLPRRQIMDLIDEADMLVLPSHLESFGTVALEAMARHRVVLVSAQCGVLNWPELARGLFAIGENETLAKAVLRVAEVGSEVFRERTTTLAAAARVVNDDTLDHWLDILRSRANCTHA